VIANSRAVAELAGQPGIITWLLIKLMLKSVVFFVLFFSILAKLTRAGAYCKAALSSYVHPCLCGEVTMVSIK